MTISPDLPGFAAVDVTTLDATDDEALVDVAMDRAAVLMPDWTPREGDVGVTLLEELAPLVAALAARIEAAPPAATMQLVGMSGLPRAAGTSAVVAVTVTMGDALGHTLPAGTRIMATLAGVDEPLMLLLDGDVVVAAAATTGTGTASAEDAGTVLGLSTATPLMLMDPVGYVDLVEVTSVTSAGTDPETDVAYMARGSAWSQAATQALVRPAQFAWRALTDVRVGRAVAVQRWDGVLPATEGTDLGHVTVLVLDPAGAALGGPVMGEVETTLTDLASVEVLGVHVQAPVVVDVPVTATWTYQPGWSSAVVDAAVAAAVDAWLSPVTWLWGATVVVSVIEAVIEAVPGAGVATVTAPAADVVIGIHDLVNGGLV